jgi:hypothetical protein
MCWGKYFASVQEKERKIDYEQANIFLVGLPLGGSLLVWVIIFLH